MIAAGNAIARRSRRPFCVARSGSPATAVSRWSTRYRRQVRPIGKVPGSGAALGVATLLLSSCATLDAYSRRNAEAMCPSLYQCIVYDDTGRHLSPCWEAEGRKATV
jgi:hypothetical protein